MGGHSCMINMRNGVLLTEIQMYILIFQWNILLGNKHFFIKDRPTGIFYQSASVLIPDQEGRDEGQDRVNTILREGAT